jgi:PAS domain S-box-containing protein
LAADPIFVADANGVYVDVNERACRLLGYSREQLIGKRIVDVLPPTESQRLGEFKQSLDSGESKTGQWEMVHRDGKIVPVEVSARAVGGGLCQAIVRDISARKAIEKDLIRAGMESERLRKEAVAAKVAAEEARVAAEEAQKQAEAASRAKDHFLAVLSHELRTPLTPVVTAVQLLETDQESVLSAEARETLAMIRRNVDLETRLIDDLLDLTRIARGKLRLEISLIDVHAKVLNVIKMCEGDLKGKRLNLVLDLSARRHHARADPARVQQVFWNLLKNAIKFTPEGGRIEVRTRDADNGAGGERIRLEVADTGIGIDPSALYRIFDAFEQGEKAITRQYGGLGLGLAISKALVTLHEGEIWASSEGARRGATFTVELPSAESPAQTDDVPSGDNGRYAGERRLSILVVEDHPDTANALERLLRSAGHLVRTTDCVATALAAADSHDFDVLISDIGLPDGSGLDLMRQIRARHGLEEKPIKGIVLSGFGMDEDVKRSQEAGFLEHLTKPINFARLQGTIEKLARS